MSLSDADKRKQNSLPPEEADHNGTGIRRRKEKGEKRKPLLPFRILHRILGGILGRLVSAVLTLGILLLLLWGFRGQIGRFLRDTVGRAFTQVSTITDQELESRLDAIGELAAYEYAYTGEREIRNVRTLFGKVSIPGTTHKIRMVYEGTIKIGCRVEEIEVHFDGQENQILVALPEVRVLDNYIDMETLQVTESNNILNPIESDEITRDLEIVKADELKRAEEADIYALAEENVRNMIGGLLADMNREIIYERKEEIPSETVPAESEEEVQHATGK